MSDNKSNSSYAFSAVEFNTKSLNPLDSINPAILNKIKRQADNYIGCANKCSQIWSALAKNDIAGEHLSQNSLRQFIKIFDQDKDGCLNPDQQISIFSFIKQKVQLIANNCLQIQSYIKFQALMRQVRLLEQNISKWQQHLRIKIHKNQLNKYKAQGQNRIDQFCNKFDNQYENLFQTMANRRQAFEKQAYYQSQQLEERLGQNTEYLKIKPSNRLKQLQIQQKLVSLQERVYQALDFRRQLSQLQVKQRQRVDKLMIQHANHQRQNLRKKHAKQRNQLQIKLQQMQNKLNIKMKKQFQVLRKKNNLHEIEIKRLQGLQKKWAQKKALFQPELKRTKKLEKQRNQVLEQYKKSMFGEAKIDQIQQGPGMSKYNAKSVLDATIKFKLTNRSSNDMPINSKQIKINNNVGQKISKYIQPSNTQKSYSLCKLYDSNLQMLQVQPVVNQSIKQQQKTRKFNFVMEKLNK